MNEVRDIHKPVIQFLRKNHLPYINHRPDVKSGIRSGWPDFSIFLAGRCLFLEAKTETGVVSPKQWICIADLERAGNTVKIVRSASEAISAVQIWAGIINDSSGPAGSQNEAPRTDLSGTEGISEATSESAINAACFPATTENKTKLVKVQPAQNLWIGNLYGTDYVFRGDFTAGSTAEKLRRATIQDLRDLPRK